MYASISMKYDGNKMILGAYSSRSYAVLRLRTGETKGPLLEHAFPQVANQPVNHFLQFYAACRTSCQEDHRDRILVLLHSLKDGPKPP